MSYKDTSVCMSVCMSEIRPHRLLYLYHTACMLQPVYTLVQSHDCNVVIEYSNIEYSIYIYIYTIRDFYNYFILFEKIYDNLQIYVYCTLYTVQCKMYIVQCKMYIVQCKMYIVHCILYTLYYTVLHPIVITHVYNMVYPFGCN